MPDLYNGRLLGLLESAASDTHAARAALEESRAAASAAAPADGVPGALLARWNFGFAGRPFVHGSLATGCLSGALLKQRQVVCAGSAAAALEVTDTATAPARGPARGSA